jgi:predicted nucleic acid-binding protein
MHKRVVLDACVLYSPHLRDFLLHLAIQNLYRPRWTDRINDEWIQNLLKKRLDLNIESFERLRFVMNNAFPKANVKGYEFLIEGLNLPDKNDRHVLAAAIKCKAETIITFNIRDFPEAELSKYSIRVEHPDDFITSEIEEHPIKAVQAFMNQVEQLKHPPITTSQILDKFRRTHLIKTANLLEALLDQV